MDARKALDALLKQLANSHTDIRVALYAYERTGDHDHGRGPISPGAACPGGDCIVEKTRQALEALSEVAR